MGSRWWSAGIVVIALLTLAAHGASAQLGVPAPQPGVPATSPAPPAAVAPGQPAGDDASRRLGRKYPIPMPPPVPRDPPEVHVSVVSPQDSGVHQHAARERMQRAARSGGDLGAAAPGSPAPPLP